MNVSVDASVNASAAASLHFAPQGLRELTVTAAAGGANARRPTAVPRSAGDARGEAAFVLGLAAAGQAVGASTSAETRTVAAIKLDLAAARRAESARLERLRATTSSSLGSFTSIVRDRPQTDLEILDRPYQAPPRLT